MRNFFCLAVLGACLPAWGWGPEGHRLIVRIAEAQLTPAARDRVAAILGPDRTLVSVASWADEVRRSRPETAPWHFVDIEITDAHLDMARDCPNRNCVIAKIEDFRKALLDPALTSDARREAFMFLVHFVGDMHQPLHCSDNHDKGGNDVKVEFLGHQTNLHSVWDTALLARIGDEETLFTPLSQASARHARKWSKGTVEKWADQMHRDAQKLVYGKLPKAAPGAPVVLTSAYEKKADPYIQRQIEKAGARLARILNETLQ